MVCGLGRQGVSAGRGGAWDGPLGGKRERESAATTGFGRHHSRGPPPATHLRVRRARAAPGRTPSHRGDRAAAAPPRAAAMPPRRATFTYTSEDAAGAGGTGDLNVYYCAFAGTHALTLSADLATLPRRRTDGAIIVDTKATGARLYVQDGGVNVVKRRGGRREVQHRVAVGGVPIGYRAAADSPLLYILPDALTAHGGGSGGGGGPPVPPCILPLRGGGCAISAAVVGGPAAAVLKLAADHVTLQVADGAGDDGLLELVRTALGVRRSAVAAQRGVSPAHRLLLVTGVTPPVAFDKLAKAAKASQRPLE